MEKDIIRAILIAKGYTASTLAADLEVSKSTANRLLHGKRSLSFKDLYLISEKLKVSQIFLGGLPGEIAARKKCSANNTD